LRFAGFISLQGLPAAAAGGVPDYSPGYWFRAGTRAFPVPLTHLLKQTQDLIGETAKREFIGLGMLRPGRFRIRLLSYQNLGVYGTRQAAEIALMRQATEPI